ncbi:hypothetical protein PPL_02083 [Heterostelium album PN500]|uniref:Uncharacterized protein n=1 Tax=Heterostelium pallidum (strain ATCC 26659 / Pp 5 / PN500) TaxID=670386 RepID=D3B1B2_HETP5|nr:hypothetical protein PPL_02083 [Heterostelium album PN500]
MFYYRVSKNGTRPPVYDLN